MTLARPPVGRASVVSTRSVVVFPAPFGPSSPKIEPRRTAKLRPSTARVSERPRPYVLTRFSTRIATSVMNTPDRAALRAAAVRIEQRTLDTPRRAACGWLVGGFHRCAGQGSTVLALV